MQMDDETALFVDPTRWSDMDRWHAEVATIRRDKRVVTCTPEGFQPFHVLTRHADVFQVSRNNDLWENTNRSVLIPDAEFDAMTAVFPAPATLVHLDGVEHQQHRQIATPLFKPAAVRNRQDRIDDLAELFVQRMRDLGGACDFAQDIAVPFTLRVIMDLYGVPEDEEPVMLELTQGIFGAADPEYLGTADDPTAKVIESVMRFIQYFNDLTDDRRAHPADDLATVIANGRIDGEYIAPDRRLWYYIIVATAGHDTTSFALSGGMEALLRDQEQFRALRDEPELAGNAAEECIRWTSPVRHFLRYATKETDVAGIEFSPGDRVLLSYPSANRDEDVFADPMTFDVRRSDVDKLISFGVGAHFCLGAQFARREVRTMLRSLARELEEVELAGDPKWSESPFVSGVKHLPIAYRFR